MASNPTRSEQASGSAAAVQAALTKDGARRADASGSVRKASGYGLPCAKCHLYYAADLDACPTCKSK
jgi:hypothetical protein